ncbi:beta-N-acetylhexosaminidase [Gracilinema caldarium]|uniref:beta-N-acetylhexosaminidase n=1 Tax=Gracilinema caldarium (strain ATCC 51460 / DSM 7334 / H1) TaxID=744872 RepID=F8F443_GRAC1|nr:family 20 glycosylhydrolase [Gracilinema caldarium]AEJ20062.1 Glycoside hydrolase, family 20, catalytic core [Gracilinema caldarium DSM 7334]
MAAYASVPAIIPKPAFYQETGDRLYAATLTLDGDSFFLPQLRALRDEIITAFGETVLSPLSSAEEFAYFEQQTHDETPLWGANFRRDAAPTIALHIHQVDERSWVEQARMHGSELADGVGAVVWGAYLLTISPSGIEMVIPRTAGRNTMVESAAAAFATLMQLLHLGWDGWRFKLPVCTIVDRPALAWRGLMIDSARHFVPVPELKKILSMAWLYKLNRFHWHLTDDQGWRLELVTLPEATGSGSTRPGGDPNRNGYYTQEEVRDIVAFAGDRGITVIPELDLPGHVQAILAGHPEFACTPGPHYVRTEWGISEDVLCMGNPAALNFALKAWDEVCELFPGPYVHIGGDEVPTTRWESCPKCAAKKAELGLTDWIDLHGYFVATIAEHLSKKGKIVFGWDEVLDSSIPNLANVVHWRAWIPEQSTKALSQGRWLVRSPYFPYYLDFVQTDDRSISPGLAYRNPDAASLRRIYEYDPFEEIEPDIPESVSGTETAQCSASGREAYLEGVPEQDAGQGRALENASLDRSGRFLGIQANAWTEYIRDGRRLEYMLFPRLLALAETAWNGRTRSSYEDFLRRLEAGHCGSSRGIFAQRGINFCPLYKD